MMVYDRTLEDVLKSREIVEKKVKNFLKLSSEDLSVLERGMLTINVLNRIETNLQKCKNLIQEMGYYNSDVDLQTWESTNIFTKKDFEKIIENLNKLKDAFFVYSDTPSVSKIQYGFQNINNIEKILYDIEQKTFDIKSKYKRCGTVVCGG